MQVVSAFQLLQGYKSKDGGFSSPAVSLIQPIQMLPYKDKDNTWRAHAMDWPERQGIEQIQLKYRRLNKNYQLAEGIIDRADYCQDEMNENKDILDVLSRQSDPNSLTELKFYPIIPNIVDLLVGEFLKRNNRVTAYAVDELSVNEKLDKKKQLVNDILIQQAQMEIVQNLIDMGEDMESEEAQQMLSMENIQSLPDVEKFIRKSYQNVAEQWANHRIKSDRARFRMDELEMGAFRDAIITNQEFWEIQMFEDDYEPRLLDPRHVFYHMSPGGGYISEGNFAGYIELMTIADVIDTFGWKMDEDEIKSLESIFPDRNASFLLNLPNDGSYYDTTKSYLDNQRGGSLQYKQLMAFEDTFGGPRRGRSTSLDQMLGAGNTEADRSLLRVTTGYWKSQKRVGHLSKIDENGELMQAIISEDFEITVDPIYDTTFYKEKTKDNLVYGEHIDWIWINEVWGGVKIGRNLPSTIIQSTVNGQDPIYLGIGSKKRPDRLPYQFKSNSSIYGCAIPIEGTVFFDSSPVDRVKPFQVSYNFVNNQISDILIDELGTVIIIDQNMIPKHSMGQDWGPNNLTKAYVAMKNFQMLPLDTSLQNTEVSTHFNGLQKIDASQTERLLGKIQLSLYFKNEAFAAIGITPERLGTVNSQQTATGTQTAVNNSYAQTEKYFTQHSDFLMPRVWELMLSAAQYYTSKGSVTLSYINEDDDEIIWQMPDGIDLLPREIDIYCTTSFEKKELKRKLEQLAIENNTTGASIFDLGRIFTLDTPSDILDALRESELKFQKQQQAQQEHEAKLQEQMLQAQAQEAERIRQFEASENQKDREAKILGDQIRAAGYPDDTGDDDYMNRLQMIQSQQEYSDTMGLKREQETNKQSLERDKMSIKREEMQVKREQADKALQAARENNVESRLQAQRKKREQAKKKKK